VAGGKDSVGLWTKGCPQKICLVGGPGRDRVPPTGGTMLKGILFGLGVAWGISLVSTLALVGLRLLRVLSQGSGEWRRRHPKAAGTK
jgi:hypothetical protein